MAKHALRLKLLVLTCLCAAWPLAAPAQQAPAKPAERLAVSQTAPLDANDPLVLWFKEQDKLLDDILTRLARIELLVREIYRLISQLPDHAQAPAAPATPAMPAAAPQPAPPPVVAPAPAPTVVPAPSAAPPVAATPASVLVAEPKKPRRAPPPEEEEPQPAGFGTLLAEYAPLLGGAALVILLLLWWSRRGKTTPQAKPAVAAAPESAPAASTQPELAPATISLPDSHLDVGSGQADQALELADIMLSMGLGHGAAQTLTEQIRSEPKQALRHWLKLLEIYRSNGQQEEFEQSAEQLRLHFNVKPEDWKVSRGAQQSLENFPHIASRIVALWPKVDCLVYLDNLLADNRGGARSGFPQAVAEEFLLLEGMLRYELIP